MSMDKVLILGAGSFALEVEDLIHSSYYEDDYYVIGYAVDTPNNLYTEMNEKPIFNWPADVVGTKLVTAIISPNRKGFIEQCEGWQFINVVRGTLSSLVELGTDIIINRGAVISGYTKIEDHVIVNRGALIGHHNRIERFATIGPGANLAGNVTIKEQAFIGMGAIVLEGLTIGKNAIIGAGAVVTKNVPDGAKAIGIPAKWTSQ